MESESGSSHYEARRINVGAMHDGEFAKIDTGQAAASLFFGEGGAS